MTEDDLLPRRICFRGDDYRFVVRRATRPGASILAFSLRHSLVHSSSPAAAFGGHAYGLRRVLKPSMPREIRRYETQRASATLLLSCCRASAARHATFIHFLAASAEGVHLRFATGLHIYIDMINRDASEAFIRRIATAR